MEKWTHGYVEDSSDWVVWGPEDKHGDPETMFQPTVCTLSSSYGEREARLIAAAPCMAALVDRVANLNPDAGEIGAGMLAQLVSEARRVRANVTGADQ